MSDALSRLTPGGRSELGTLARQPWVGMRVAEAVLARGGTGRNVAHLTTEVRGLFVWEAANRASAGDADANRAIKMIKQARRLGQRY